MHTYIHAYIHAYGHVHIGVCVCVLRFLNCCQAQLHLISKPGDFLGAADKALDDLRAKDWYDADTTDLQLGFDTYGKESGMLPHAVTAARIGQ